jgi:hypothetical protein
MKVSVAVRKPRKFDYVRVNSAPDHFSVLPVIETSGGDFFLVAPSLRGAPEVARETRRKAFVTAVTPAGELFLWPLVLVGEGRPMQCHVDQWEAANRARETWLRIAWDSALSRYGVWQAAEDLGPPDFSGLSGDAVLALAFKSKIIDRVDHPVLRQLGGYR